MRVAQLATRALLGGLAMDHLDIMPEVSPAGLLVRQSSTCDVGEKTCGDGCIPLSGVCCAR